MATYSLEPAKSARATCKKCKLKIEKEDLRVGVHRVTADDIVMVNWHHASCFHLPKKVTLDDFFGNLQVNDDVSKAQLAHLRKQLSDTDGGAAGNKRLSGASDGGSNKKSKADITKNMTSEELELFEKYKAFNLESLKDFMRWNKQPIAGTKNELILRCIDGESLGALPGCPEPGCKGKLKLENGKATCGGAFNDELGTFVRCYYSADASSIERLPWRESKPTEGKEVARRLYKYSDQIYLEEVMEDSKFEATVNLESAKNLFDGLDMSQLADKREAVNRFLKVARDEGIDVGSDDNAAKIKLGTLVMGNSGLSPEELLSLAESELGTVKKTKAKLEGASTGTVCEGNEGIVKALTELSQAYFKSGNANAGNTYRKAAASVRSCPDLILSGKRVSKGKDKLDGVGAKCGEYIDEFLETGTISKIAEKS